MDLNEKLTTKLEAIIAVARTGLAWTQENLYEHERYERILELAADMAALFSEAEAEPAANSALATTIKAGWMSQVTPGASGYVTPKISTGAACFDPQGRILLGRRGDSGLWFFPTGWQEVGLTPAENIVKEVREETGIICRPIKLIAVRDTRFYRPSVDGPVIRNPHQSSIHNIALTFLCEALSNEFKLHPLETREAGFYTEEEALNLVPKRVWSVIQQGFSFWRGEVTEPYFDLPLT